MQQVAVNIVDDDDVEITEQFSVSLSTVDGKVTIGTHQTANVLIIDDDRKFAFYTMLCRACIVYRFILRLICDIKNPYYFL